MSITHTHEFTPEEITLIEHNGLTLADVRDVLSRFGEQELETAIGTAVQIKAGHVPPIENPQVQKEVPEDVAREGQEKSSGSSTTTD